MDKLAKTIIEEGKSESLLNKVFKSIFGAATISYAEERSQKPTLWNLKNRGVSVTQDDLNEAKHVIFSEISNREPEKQDMETRIILNTALNRMKQYEEKGQNKTLTEVLQMPNQYQGYMPDNPKSQYMLSKSGALDEASSSKSALIEKVLEDVKMGDFQDNTQGSVYYYHDKDGRIWLKEGKLFK